MCFFLLGRVLPVFGHDGHDRQPSDLLGNFRALPSCFDTNRVRCTQSVSTRIAVLYILITPEYYSSMTYSAYNQMSAVTIVCRGTAGISTVLVVNNLVMVAVVAAPGWACKVSTASVRCIDMCYYYHNPPSSAGTVRSRSSRGVGWN